MSSSQVGRSNIAVVEIFGFNELGFKDINVVIDNTSCVGDDLLNHSDTKRDTSSSEVINQILGGAATPASVLTRLFEVSCHPDDKFLSRVHTVLRVSIQDFLGSRISEVLKDM